jgi:hypothetical protein
MKQTWCNPTHQGLSNGIKSATKEIVIWEEAFRPN